MFLHSRYFFGFVVFIFFSNSAFSLNETEIEKKVKQAIEERHPSFDQNWWLALGNAAPIIIRLYRSNQNEFQKDQLIQALSYYDDPQAIEFLKSIATDSQNKVRKTAAIRTIGKNPLGKEEVEFLSDFLEDSNPHIRVEAARALNSVYESSGSKKAKQKLDDYKSKEKTPWVRAKLENNPAKYFNHVPKTSSKKLEVSKLFVGTFEGFWIREIKGKLVSESSRITLKRVKNNQFLEGQIQSKTLTLRLLSDRGSGLELPVTFKNKRQKLNSSRGSIAIQQNKSKAVFLAIDAPHWSSKFWLKKIK